ncbi:uncharacterized protein LOC121735987 isoform X2 [Aricia agestis]|uniref:uncharacterized protein LOC121735987 isoform X2 n=1 Tax=Aricia agestis TaxID=91739 RepID=UPI001C20343A|nr:uncharacterized protein LOC121735987 isoform X2 [Aricia agestis]
MFGFRAKFKKIFVIQVMRRVSCADACPAPTATQIPNRSENKELLRQQLLSSKERSSEEPRAKVARSRQKNRWKLKFHHQALPQEYLDHYEQSLQKASARKQEKKETETVTNETFKIWAQRLAGADGATPAPPPKKEKKKVQIAPSKVVSYEDLPYMGEMTLNNSKPRRGRKPKKADICHLIYENYGTVVPGQPPPPDRPTPDSGPAFKNPLAPKTDLQNRLISSLLERKLSQEKRRLESDPPTFCSPDGPMPAAPPTAAGPLHSDHEPLNLCIRDLRDLKLQIQRKFGNIYSSADVKTEVDEEAPGEQPNAISVIQRNTSVPTANSSPDLSRRAGAASPTLSEPARAPPSPGGELPGYVYWPHAGVYVHPLALQTQLLYYQRLAAAHRAGETTPPGETASPDENRSKLVLKQISELLDPKVMKQDERPDLTKKRASPNPTPAPAKRKRSAIFIPPVPARPNPATPTAEVSICKFKFTGGSKPSLQEKKMLSVDSGGNFTYYSGTGAKGNKGYEFLQRDQDKSPEFPPEPKPDQTVLKEDANKRKRKTRKTLQREKLEQTFKEKGFLIQTQQLQSAEGATYCKFRQLRKFTRYLFRSWKDYLPGELDERTEEKIVPSAEQAEW